MQDWLFRDFVNPTTAIGAVVYGVLLLLLAIIGAKLVKRWTRRVAAHSHLGIDPTAMNFIGQLLQVGCFGLAIFIYAHIIPALEHLASALLASAGVVSLVIGLAAQNTLGQLIAGIALLLYRPYGIGDVLVVTVPTGTETGTVKEFTLGYTKLQAKDGRWIIVPNSVMASTTIVRVSTETPH
ncbi:MAG TPA: mechanosensitive ion channel family protein [Tepidisphaeraceae bacterium]|nr:mechanosensitive ion channel family protein [Tepidisphaeraceae bacterium]